MVSMRNEDEDEKGTAMAGAGRLGRFAANNEWFWLIAAELPPVAWMPSGGEWSSARADVLEVIAVRRQ